MGFTTKSWQDWPNTTTPFNAAAMVDLEQRLSNYSHIYNVESTTYGAVPDAFFTDGVSNSTTTFTSATANFTVADVGKTIVILLGSLGDPQDHHTTISSVSNSTTVILNQQTFNTNSPLRFYISRGGDQTTAIQAAINAAAAAGGGEVHCPGVGYLVSGLVLKNRVTLSGAGKRATMLHLIANANVPVVRNDYTSGTSAMFGGIKNIWLDGARYTQSPITPTVGATYTAGNTTLTVSDASQLLPRGMVKIASNRLSYQSISGNVLQTVAGGQENTTDAGAAIGATVTQYKSCCVYLLVQGGTPGNEHSDPHFLLDNVLLKNSIGDGFQEYSNSETRLNNVLSLLNDEFGFRPSWDTWFSNCTAEQSGRSGFFLYYAPVLLSNCKAFNSGGVTTADGHGFFFASVSQPFLGTQVCVNCLAEDNTANGFLLLNTDRAELHGAGADSNSKSTVGTYAGFKLTGANKCILDGISVERKFDGTNSWQQNALDIDVASSGNKIRLSHGAAGSASVGTALKSGSDPSGGNDLSINGQGGFLTAAFAASYTPDPYAATTIKLGALTAALTVNAPSNAHTGCPLTFILVQDGTGGRTVTWNATFSTTYANTGNTLSKKLIISFVYDGTNWQQTYISQSATAGTYWI